MIFVSSQPDDIHRDNLQGIIEPYVRKVFEMKKIEEKNRAFFSKEHNKKFICSFCDSEYVNMHQFELHLNSHKRESKHHECEYCLKKFTQKSNLKTHMRIHTGERPFLCTSNHCHMSFKTQGQLQDHLYRHYDLKPFKCEVCAKAFNRKSRVKRHMMIHLNEKPFKCDYVNCQKAFRQKGTLKTHYHTHIKKLNKTKLASPRDLIVNTDRENMTVDDNTTIISHDFSSLKTFSDDYDDHSDFEISNTDNGKKNKAKTCVEFQSLSSAIFSN